MSEERATAEELAAWLMSPWVHVAEGKVDELDRVLAPFIGGGIEHGLGLVASAGGPTGPEEPGPGITVWR